MRAKHHALSTLLDEEDSMSGGFAVLWSLAVSGLPLRHYDQLAREIEELTESDVREAARKHFAGCCRSRSWGTGRCSSPFEPWGSRT